MASSDQFADLDRLLDEALELPADEREAFLVRLTATHSELAAEITDLLARMPESEDFLGEQALRERDELLAESLRRQAERGGLQAGDRLGVYRIDRIIGQGLRSTVCLATRRDEEWAQQVAIKIMTRGINSDDVYRRFLSERQILTELRHPHITTLLDGGVSADGLPYFVMEFIDGLPITDHCRELKLARRDRVQLFRRVCEAVAHAHRHLVVHRDIKPSNILVTGDGEVKLLDFGIAKLLDPGLEASDGLLTEEFSRPMTPAYSSPEQFAGAQITTATDVYQLGLLLSEMLTNAHPIRKALGIEQSGVPETPPSRVAIDDGSAPPYPLGELRGDLDWIVLKALEPQPGQRYGSAAELLADIDRYLGDRPVSARSATLPYVIRKFARRRPGLALAAGLAIATGVGYLALLAYFNVQLTRERTAALEAAARAEEVKDLLVRFISSPDPYQGSGVDTRVSQLLAQSEAFVTDELHHRPELQAELFGVFADTYQGLSLPVDSIRMRERELALRRPMDPVESLGVLHSRRKLADAMLSAGDVPAALAEMESVHARLLQLDPLPVVELAVVKNHLGQLHAEHGARQDAIAYLDDAVRMLQESGEAPLELASALYGRSALEDDYARRHEYLEQAYDIRRDTQGPLHPDALIAQAAVAANLTRLDRYDDSLAVYAEVIPRVIARFGQSHEQTINMMNNRAVTYYISGDYESSVREHRNLLAINREKFGDVHRDVAESLQNLGAALNVLGRYEEAIKAVTEASQIFEQVNLPGNYTTAYPHITLAITYARLGQAERIEHHARQAIGFLEGHVPETDIALLKSRCLLGDALIRQGDPETGVPLLEASIEGLSDRPGVMQAHIDECKTALERAAN